jgi:oligoendopeptidase F
MNWTYHAEGNQGGMGAVPERSSLEAKYQWDLARLYASDQAWEADYAKIDSLVAPLEAMRGTLSSAEAVAKFLDEEIELDRMVHKLYVYAHLKQDEDTAHSANQARMARVQARLAEVSARLAWSTPEILANSQDDLKAWVDSDILKKDRYALIRLLRRKPHTLSDKEEILLSQASDVFAAPSKAFQFLTDADLTFPEIEDGQGNKVELSKGRYILFLLDKNRQVRKRAFEALSDTYGGVRNTLASTLSSHVKLQNFIARARSFPSALEASLHEDNVPKELYESLIAATHSAFGHYYDYLDLRKHQLGIQDLDIYDVYVPLVPEYEVKVPYEEAQQWVLEACAPLGEEYVSVLKTAFTDGWIDVYENRGKRSGAYSSGCYDSLPYILLNYQGTLSNVFTLIHELGHSMHSYLANEAQSPRFSRYPIFLAEIASTLNEGLLLTYLLKKQTDPRFRAYLLNHLCDGFKGTVYRQTMFAEFEKIIHEMDASATPLTAESMADTYYDLNAQYFGPGMQADRRIALEWSRVPHFYYNFYVYKYATSFCASQLFLQRVLEGEQKRDQFLDLLRAGGSDDPLALVQRAGVDLADKKTLESAFETFGKTVKELGAVLKGLSEVNA